MDTYEAAADDSALQASTAEPEPTGEAGTQVFATLLEFLQAMLGSDLEDVAAAARGKVQQWEGRRGGGG